MFVCSYSFPHSVRTANSVVSYLYCIVSDVNAGWNTEPSTYKYVLFYSIDYEKRSFLTIFISSPTYSEDKYAVVGTDTKQKHTVYI